MNACRFAAERAQSPQPARQPETLRKTKTQSKLNEAQYEKQPYRTDGGALKTTLSSPKPAYLGSAAGAGLDAFTCEGGRRRTLPPNQPGIRSSRHCDPAGHEPGECLGYFLQRDEPVLDQRQRQRLVDA